MRAFSDRFDAESKAQGLGSLAVMLVSAAITGGLTWWEWPPSLASASMGTLLGIGLGASLTLLFLVLSGFTVHHLLGAMGLRRVEGRVEAEGRNLRWRLEFDTDEQLGDIQISLKVSRETFRCRLVRKDIPKEHESARRSAGGSYKMVPEWSSDGEVVVLERKLGTFVFPSSRVLEGSLDSARPLPHPRTTSASHPSRGETTRDQALAAFPEDDPVGRELFAAATASIESEDEETIAARLQVVWRLDVFAERQGWPDAGISLLLRDQSFPSP